MQWDLLLLLFVNSGFIREEEEVAENQIPYVSSFRILLGTKKRFYRNATQANKTAELDSNLKLASSTLNAYNIAD